MIKPATKALSVLLCAALLVGTAACSSNTASTNNTASAAPSETQSAASEGSTAKSSETVEKPKQITAMLDAGIVKTADGQKQFCEEFKKETGIELKVTQPNHNEYIQKVKMSFASGDIPDIVEINNDNMVQFANNGALYDISDLVKNSEVFQNIMTDPQSKNTFESVKVNGKLYACPAEKGTGVVSYIRKDLLDKANLKIPTTYDEFITVLKAFAKMKTKDGKAIIPYTAPGLDPESSNYLPQFYQKTTGRWEQKDGKWIDGFTTDAMKDTLTKMQAAYKEGLLDKEIVTNKTSTCRDKWYAGQVGVFSYWAGNWAINLTDKLKATTPDAEVVAMPAIEGTHYTRRIPQTLAITAKTKNPKGIFKYFFEYIHDGKDGTMLWTHGVKDVHYKADNGKYEPLPSLSDPSVKFTRAVVDLGMNLEPNFKDPFTIDDRITTSNKILSDAEQTTPLCPPSESYYKNGGTLQTLRSQITANIVIQGKSVDDGISQYKSQAGAKVEQILKEFNEAK
ncbi:MAG: extracellular solute-binding protein [Oscillospiraceae bacterium]|nr:extracellular solute-binding protein [Oscillospiraceae bacterium]